MKNCKFIVSLLLLVSAAICGFTMKAEFKLDYNAGVTAAVGGGEFAPHYFVSNRHGTISSSKSTNFYAAISHSMDSTQRFSYGFGANVYASYKSIVDYKQFSTESFELVPNSRRPAPFWLQQLYGEVKYRGMSAIVGMKERHSVLVNENLSSGDLTRGANARPMPGVTLKFVDFQNIPLTKGWVQINAEVSFYKSFDNQWLKDHYNYLNHSVTTGMWYNYQFLHFRTKPSQPVSFTIGMQSACQFGGTQRHYENGMMTKETVYRANFKSFIKAMIPKGGGGSSAGDKAYYEGNHLGSWDASLRWRINDSHTVRAYWSSPWEDGSGIGKLNGFDGLYGLEYSSPKHAPITGAVIEYLDFTNQGGPIHFNYDDWGGTFNIKGHASGRDDYYNNYAYNGYAYHGMSIGTPFVPGTIYNTDGYLSFTHNRLRGFHAAITGYITPQVTYRGMISYRRSWGSGTEPLLQPQSCTSMMVEASYCPSLVDGMNMKAAFAFDRGQMLGNNMGVLIGITYKGNFSF